MGIEQSPGQSHLSSDKAELQDIVTLSSAVANLAELKQSELREIIEDSDSDEIDTHMATVELIKSNLELRCITALEGMKLLKIAQKDPSSYDADKLKKVSDSVSESLGWIQDTIDVIESQYGINARQVVEKYGLADLI